jgi:hypothetical protein
MDGFDSRLPFKNHLKSKRNMKNKEFVSVGSIAITEAETSIIESVLSRHFTTVKFDDELLQDNYYGQLFLKCRKPVKDSQKNEYCPEKHSVIVRNKRDKDGNTQYSANITLYGYTKIFRKHGGFKYGEIARCYMYDTCLQTLCNEILIEYERQKNFYQS